MSKCRKEEDCIASDVPAHVLDYMIAYSHNTRVVVMGSYSRLKTLLEDGGETAEGTSITSVGSDF